jgi:hypothetical protein
MRIQEKGKGKGKGKRRDEIQTGIQTEPRTKQSGVKIKKEQASSRNKKVIKERKDSSLGR